MGLRFGRSGVGAGSLVGRRLHRSLTHVEGLESRLFLAAQPVITEFMASNGGGLMDGNGARSDWIEIQNQGDATLSLAGWHLTDDPTRPAKWNFPARVLNPGQFLVVFASGNGAPDPAGNLHTNFSLGAGGEYVALTRPDLSVASAFGAAGADFPNQLEDVSYGFGSVFDRQALIGPTAPARAIVPTNNSLDNKAWTGASFNDAGWLSGNTGVGFDQGGVEGTPTPFPTVIGRWTADDLNALADGAIVNSWTSSVGAAVASRTGNPRLEKNEINGHSVVRFDPTDGSADRLRVPAASNPMSGRNDFAIAVVFRTSTPGAGGAGQWWQNSGIVDGEVGGVTNDWGLVIDGAGQVGAGLGNPDLTLYSNGRNLADGAQHVAIYSRRGGTFQLYIDGGIAFQADGAGVATRMSADMVFGALQTNLNHFRGDIAEVQVMNGALDAGQADQLATDLGSKYAVALAPDPYDPLIGLDLQSRMAGVATSAYVRVPFTVDDPSRFDRLSLLMKYDDGFAAYLNGTLVASRNAPGALGYTSAALGPRADGIAVVPEEIDISAFRHLLQGNGAPNVLAVHALNSAASDPDLLVAPELIASRTIAGPSYFTTPTPGAANVEGFLDYVRDVHFSVDRGILSAPTTIDITTATPGATIVYTTDGSIPTLTNGIAVAAPDAATAPLARITVNKTTTLRATAFRINYIPTNVDTQTYVFVSSVLSQPNVQPAGAYWDTQMDPNVVNAGQTYSVADALTSIPTMSLVLPDADVFGPNGIYRNPLARGDAWERATSVEYFDPADPAARFQIDAGVRIQGGVSRDPSRPKKSLRLFFREQYGQGKLDFPLFGEFSGAREFDSIVLRGGHNYSWANAGGTPVERSDYLRDEFSRRTQAAMTGKPVARGTFVQLYINGLYWGLYNVTEQPDENWASEHFGGADEDYDVLQPDNNGGLEVLSGTADAWNALFAAADAAVASGGVIDDAEYASLRQRVDVDNLIDYMLGIIYRGDTDAPTLIGNGISPRNFYAVRSRLPGGLFQFQTWDGELSMDQLNIDRTETAGNLNPARLYQQLRSNAEFRQLVADRAYQHLFHGGALSVATATQRLQALKAEIDKAIVGESARWGDAKREPPGMRDTDWLGEMNWLLNTYLPQRSNIVLSQLRTDFPMLNTLPPEFRINGAARHGGQVNPGDTLTLVNTNAGGGTIYYTTDGSDPRLPGGSPSPRAFTYSGSIPISQNLSIRARVRSGTTWSPIDVVDFNIHTLAAAANLTVAEVNFHPHAPTPAELAVNPSFTADDFEFVELLNTGTTTVDLLEAEFDAGISFEFGNTSVAPGQRVVIVRDLAAFRARYGSAISVAGTYGGGLSDNGETLRLRTASGAIIRQFAYDDADSWHGRADGNGSTLEIIGVAGDYDDARNWRSSYEYGGTPGSAGAGPNNDVVVNEVLSNTNAPTVDAIELHNTTTADIDLSGWFLSDSNDDYKKFRIPDGTVIPAGEYLVFDESHFNAGGVGFALDGSRGDDVWLVKAALDSRLLAFADSVHFDAAPVGESFGRWPNATGGLYPMSAPTLGTVNSGPRIGPAIISEVMYRPAGDNPILEYLEIQNVTPTPLDVSNWRLDNGVDFTFPAGTSLQPYEPILLVPFDPGNATTATAFRSAYGIDSTVRLFGPYTGVLNDTGETVRLARPDTPSPTDPTFVPYVLVDEIDYEITAPWPTPPAGATGQSLSRRSRTTFAHDPANWTAAAPTAGSVPFGHAYFQGGLDYVYTAAATLLDSLTIRADSKVSLSPGHKVLRTAALQLHGNATLDLDDGYVIVDATAETKQSVLDGVNAAVRTAYDAIGPAHWTGPGITSTAARIDFAKQTAVGVLLNDAGAGQPLLTSFGGQPVTPNSILLRHTLLGDADLSGDVAHADFLRLRAGFGRPGAYWGTGDFNFDGKANFADFQVQERTFGKTLPAPAAATRAATAATASFPVPAKPAPANTPRKRPIEDLAALTSPRRPAARFSTRRIA